MYISLRYLLIILAFFTSILIGAIIIVYESTKSSYHAVGYNNGEIITKLDIVEVVKHKIGASRDCKNISSSKLETIVFIEAKATTLYATKHPNGLVSFCLAE